MIRIKSAKHGFRRAGIAHPSHWVEYPDDRFTEEQLDALRNEPMLLVQCDPAEGDIAIVGDEVMDPDFVLRGPARKSKKHKRDSE